MVHFPGVVWWREVWDMPHELWQWYMDVIAARDNAAKQQPKRR